MILNLLCFVLALSLLSVLRVADLLSVVCFTIPNQLGGFVDGRQNRSFLNGAVIAHLVSSFLIQSAVGLALLIWSRDMVNLDTAPGDGLTELIVYAFSFVAIVATLLMPQISDFSLLARYSMFVKNRYYFLAPYLGHLIGTSVSIILIVVASVYKSASDAVEIPILLTTGLLLLINILAIIYLRTVQRRRS